MPQTSTIAASKEIGSLGVPHLKRIWSSALVTRSGGGVEQRCEAKLDQVVLNALGLGLHQTMQHLFEVAPTFQEFENWVVETVGRPDELHVERLYATICRQPASERVSRWLRTVADQPPVLTDTDLSCWEENGYVIVKGAVTEYGRRNAERAIWEYVEADPESPDSWYQFVNSHGIMVELIQHPALEINRCSKRIHKAFGQLWGTADLWVSADRCGFHPPQKPGYPFPGPDLHWDMDFDRPREFETQGILYLTDTPPEQGALTLVPGFHKRLPDWLAELGPDTDPQQEDLHALGSKPVGGEAGDMVIWHQSLPHGSRPNLGERPRIVQYINMLPWRP